MGLIFSEEPEVLISVFGLPTDVADFESGILRSAALPLACSLRSANCRRSVGTDPLWCGIGSSFSDRRTVLSVLPQSSFSVFLDSSVFWDTLCSIERSFTE